MRVILFPFSRNVVFLNDFPQDATRSVSSAGDLTPYLRHRASTVRELRRRESRIRSCHEGHGVTVPHDVEPGK
jgi:hypothetical protein